MLSKEEVMAVVRDAGYKPIDVESVGDGFYIWFGYPTFSMVMPSNKAVAVYGSKDTIIWTLKHWAGPKNQPKEPAVTVVETPYIDFAVKVNKLPTYKDEMVDTIIAEQVRNGGYDTEGTRAQAERWLSSVCMAMQEGLMMTTYKSRFKLAKRDKLLQSRIDGNYKVLENMK